MIRYKALNVVVILLVLFSLCNSESAYGQYKLRPNIVHFSRQTYKASDKNWAVDSDKNGYVYFANNKGLLQFDGENWQLYQLPGKTIIRSVKVSDDNKIYTGSFEEFGYWERDKFGVLQYFSLCGEIASQMHNDEIWKIVLLNDQVAFQSFANIFIWDGVAVQRIPTSSSLLFLQKANKNIYVQGISNGVYTLEDKQLYFVDGSEIFNETNVRTFLPLNDTIDLFCTSHDGLYLYNAEKFTLWDTEISRELVGTDVNTGIVINDRLFAVGTLNKGIFIFNAEGQIVRRINLDDDLGSNTIYNLNVDSAGNLWVGLDKGISYVKFDMPVKLFIDNVQNIGLVYDACSVDSQLFVGTNSGLYATVIDADFPESFRFSQLKAIPELSGQVWDLNVIDDVVFCGHAEGTFTIDGNDVASISDFNGGYNIREFTRNSKKYLLQSTYSNLILYEKNEESESWQFKHLLTGFYEPGRFLEIDELGNVWVSHLHKGIYKLNLSDDLKHVKNVQYFSKEQGFPTNHKVDVFKVNNRILFTTGYGLYAYDNLKGTIVSFDLFNDQLKEFSNAKAIYPAGERTYWFLKDETAALFKIENDSIQKINQISFDLADAVLVEYFENIAKINGEYSLACLTNGFGIISNEKHSEVKYGHEPYITEINVINKNNVSRKLPLFENEKITIQPNESRVTFHYTAFNYLDGATVYKTKLSGIDLDWMISSTPHRSFERLPAGTYTLSIGKISAGADNDRGINFSFVVLPPWYLTRFAYIVYVILFISIVVAIRIYMVLKLKRQIDQLKVKQKNETEEKQRAYKQRIVGLENEKLQNEIEYKSQQLAAVTMTAITKNEMLSAIKTIVQHQSSELGPRFPKKNYTAIIETIDKYLSNDDWDIFEKNFDRAHQDFFNRLKNNFPDLTPGDIKLCAYLKMNLASKEIAHLLNISIRSVEVHRYRIRKKLSLNSNDNLVEFLIQF